MKNFFKKLSFVLAIAMVLTTVAPATASAATAEIVKKGKAAATTVYVYAGGSKVNLDFTGNGKGGAWSSSDEKIVKVDKNGVLTPVANGKAVITFTTAKNKTYKQAVTVRTRATGINIYKQAEYEAGNKNKLNNTTVEVKAGTETGIRLTLPVSAKAKALGITSSTYKTYVESSNPEVAELVRVSGQRTFTLNAKTAGEATITISAKNSKSATTYVQTATFTVKVAEASAAKQTGAKVVKVTGLEGTAKDDMAVTLKKGNNAVNVNSVKAEDANTLVITTTAKLQNADYTVKVGDKEFTFPATAEKLTFFEVTSTDAPLNDIVTKATSVTVPYKAQNQFEEPMNISIEGSSSLGTVVAKNGIATITFTTGIAREGQSATLVLISKGDVVKTISETITVVAPARIKDITFGDVYNVDGKLFRENETSTEFRVPVSFTDQYGNPVTDVARANAEVMISNSNDTVLTLKDLGASTYVAKDLKSGELYVVVSPKTSGSSALVATPKWGGPSVSTTLNVADKIKVDTISFAQPETAIQGKDLVIPFEAYDTYGELITDITVLKAFESKIKVTNTDKAATHGEFTKNYLTGEITLSVGKIDTGKKFVNVSAISDTYKSATITVETKGVSIPTVIGGVTTKTLAAVTDESITITSGAFIVYDQYDLPMNTNDVYAAGYKIKGVTASGIDGLFTTATATDKEMSSAATSDWQYTVKTDLVASATTTITLKLIDNNGNEVKGSEYSLVLGAVKKADLVTFEISTVDKVYAPATQSSIHAKDFYVYGSTANGLKVQLSTGDYSVSSYSDTGYVTVSAGKINGNSAVSWAVDNDPASTKDIVIYVQLYNGSVITKKVTACEAAPALTTVSANVSKGAAVSGSDGNFVVYDKAENVDSATEVLGYLSTLDQYGVPKTENPVAIITETSKNVTASSNGTASASVTGLTAGGSYVVTFALSTGTVTVKVIAK